MSGLFDGQGWPLSAGSVLGKLTHVGDAGGWHGPNGEVTSRMVKDLSRILLTLVFAACARPRLRGVPQEGKEGLVTGAAWTMLGVTWSVILFFTVRFFWKVLANPTPPEADDGPDIPFKDA